jgi:acyl dehydratase
VKRIGWNRSGRFKREMMPDTEEGKTAMDRQKWNERIDAFLEEENRRIGTVMPVHRIYCQDDSDRSGGGLYNETVTDDTIGRFARALGDSNPLWSDPAYAAASPYGGLIAPPLLECCICSVFIGGRFPRLRGISVFDAGTRWERFRPIRPGDTSSARTTFAGVEEVTKPGASARILVRSHLIDLYNQRDDHVSRLTARTVIRCAAPEEDRPGGHAALQADAQADPVRDRPHYTEEDLARIDENLEKQFKGFFRRGADVRWWEDVKTGEELPDQIAGPYDESDGYSLMAAIGVANAFATKWGTLHAGRGGGIIDPQTGARRLPIDRHSSDAAARAQGHPRALVYGIHSQALLAKSVSDWMGDAGQLRSLDCRCRRPVYYGDLSIQRGRVTGRGEENGRHLVFLHMEGLRQDGVVHTEADAVVELPSRK